MNIVASSTRIYTSIHVARPVEQVFDYVTTSGNWPQWHPSSLGVRGATERPMQVGEQVTEEFFVAGRRGSVVWTVTDCDPPRRWDIDGQIVGRSSGGIITYALTPVDGGTRFEREFVYMMPNALFSLFDRLIYRRRVQAESAEALRRLKAVLETGELKGG
jgi:hypothetical protein